MKNILLSCVLLFVHLFLGAQIITEDLIKKHITVLSSDEMEGRKAGTQGIETDTGLSYNPNSGTITTTAIGAHSVTGALTTQAITPDGNGTRDLGAYGTRWANVYSSDLDLSNEAKGANSIDNTWGSYLIEEGENDLFLKNRRTGKQYKFCLQEV